LATKSSERRVSVNRGLVVHQHWLLTPHRAAIHGPTATAVIADLHLGYEHARRHSGEAVPDTGTDETIAALTALLAFHPIRRLVIAGDLVENRTGSALVGDFRQWLHGVGVELAGIVPGNHDRCLSAVPGDLPIFPEGIGLNGWRVVHGDDTLPAGKLVMGHFHPCLRWPGDLTAPCYLVGASHLILPAFSADAAGANVLGVRRWRNYRCCAIAGEEVLDFGLLRPLHAKRKKA
jgi:putative SbcD/Mre11-related phosphoesterase